MTEWQILGITPTGNKQAIKRAYAKKLKQFHPEDHPEEFKKIQDAYNSIMNAINRNYNNTDIKLSLEVSFHKKDMIYGQREEEVRNEKPQLSSVHDSFNLEEAFHDIDEKDKRGNSILTSTTEHEKVNKEQIVKFTEIDNDESNYEIKQEKLLQDLLYQKFKETIRYSKDIETMRHLILNERFYEQMSDSVFFEKICRLVNQNLSSFDMVVISFLYDAFLFLEKEYDVKDKQYSVTIAIRELCEYKKRQDHSFEWMRLALHALFVIVCIFIYLSSNSKKQDPIPRVVETPQQKTKSFFEEQNYSMKAPELRANGGEYAQKAVLEWYGIEATCIIEDDYMRENSTVTVNCSTTDGNFKKSGLITLDENRQPKELKFYDEE